MTRKTRRDREPTLLIVIGKSTLNGECPTNVLVQFYVRKSIATNTASSMHNVVFHLFSGCGPIIGIDSDNQLLSEDPFPSSARIVNCTFLDMEAKDAFSFRSAANPAYQFRNFIVLAVKNTTFLFTAFTHGYAL